MRQYYVYILSNKYNNVLYTGVTNNLTRRISEHKSKSLDGFTKKYNLTKLVFFEQFGQVDDALSAEKKIKGWVRLKKNQLVESINPSWDDLALEILR
jgi:putative endonuclease